jgi:TPR repeat protein
VETPSDEYGLTDRIIVRQAARVEGGHNRECLRMGAILRKTTATGRFTIGRRFPTCPTKQRGRNQGRRATCGLILVPLLLGLLVIPAQADFQAGLAAYNQHDYAAAVNEWRPVAERGDANAEFNMGLLYSCGEGVPLDYAQAAEWYQKSAEQGVPAAEYNLAILYAKGQGVKQDKAEAAKWFTKAAAAGITQAATALGDLYSSGDGIPKDFGQAQKWYGIAAEKGVPAAQFGLGLVHDLQQDYATAIDWYNKAAGAGYAPAMTNLGVLYYNAQGEKRDLVQAYAWLARAKKGGDPRAAELLDTTAERMSKKDVGRAQKLVDQWQPSIQPQEAFDPQKLFLHPQAAPATERSATPTPVTAVGDGR